MKKENKINAAIDLFLCLSEENQNLILRIMEALLPKDCQEFLEAYRAADKAVQKIVRDILFLEKPKNKTTAPEMRRCEEVSGRDFLKSEDRGKRNAVQQSEEET